MLTRKHGRLEWWGYHSLTWHSLGEISHGFCVPKGSHFWVEQPISVNISSILSSPQVGLGRPCEISQDDWNFNFLREGLGKIRLQTPRNTKITDLSHSGHWIPTIRGFPGREKASFSGSKKIRLPPDFSAAQVWLNPFCRGLALCRLHLWDPDRTHWLHTPIYWLKVRFPKDGFIPHTPQHRPVSFNLAL